MAKKQHHNRRMAALCAAFLALGALAAGLWMHFSAFPRLEVGGFRVREEAYRWALYQARGDVLSDHAAAGISLKDWSAETSLGDPCELAMERALEILRDYYAVSTLAVERGYLADAGYDAMLLDMKQVNDQRQEALNAGGIITGIRQFTVDDFIAYRTSSLRLQFCNDPGNPENLVTDGDILARYEADRDNLYRQPDSMELTLLAANGADEALEQAFEALRQTALDQGSLSAALEAHPALKSFYQEISVNPGTYSIYARSHSDVLAWASSLQAGEISPVFRQDDRICLIHCLQKTTQQYVPLEDVRSIVEQSIRESRYDDLVAARAETIRIRSNPESLYRFTAEQLP